MSPAKLAVETRLARFAENVKLLREMVLCVLSAQMEGINSGRDKIAQKYK
jgi:hypothetical protein